MIPLTLQTAPHTTKGWMRAAARGPNPGQGSQSIVAPIPGAPLTVMPPPSVADWMRAPSRAPNPGQGNQSIGAPVPTNMQWGHSGMRGVARTPNPEPSLDGWYPSTSSSNAAQHGPPNVVGPWVEQLEPKLPAQGLLHRAGLPDVKVQIMWDVGCQMQPGGAHVCTVFAQALGPADLVRYQLPNGQQGRAQAHRVYQTPGGQLTDNPRVLQNVATYKKAWLPASYTEQKPTGITGSWVQVSPADATVGLVRIPGGVAQQSFVFEVRQDGQGRLRALVRWKQATGDAAVNPPASKYLVHTGVDKTRLLCQVMPNAPGCIRHDITEANPADNPRGRRGRRGRRRPLGTIRASGRTPRAPGCFVGTGEYDANGKEIQKYVVPCPDAGTISGFTPGARTRGLCPPGTVPNPCNPKLPGPSFGMACVPEPHQAGPGSAPGCPPGKVLVCHAGKPSCQPIGGQPMFNPVSVAATRAAINQGGGLIQSVVTGRAKVVLDRNGLSMKAA